MKLSLLTFTVLIFTFFISPTHSKAQDYGIPDVICGKWKVVWFGDAGKKQGMIAKDQILILQRDGTGSMTMGGEEIGNAQWTVLKKNKITFADDPTVTPYVVKVSKYRSGKNMLFTSTMPNGIVRKVYFRKL